MNAEKTLQNRYDRLTVGPGIVAWIYEYRNPETLEKRNAVATGLEIGVQIDGEWKQHGHLSGERLYGTGDIHTLSPAECYNLSFEAKTRPGLQVGFILYPDEFPEYATLSGELRFKSSASPKERAFFEFCRGLYHAAERMEPLPMPSIAAEVRSFVERNCELVPCDPLLLAKRELDRHYARPLYIDQIAETAHMHPITFARRFAKRFGMTPAHYRLMLRLNEAARQTWASPLLPIPEIAQRVGFDDMVYFHRAFKRIFGLTPALYGRRHGIIRTASRNEPPRKGHG